MSVQDEDADRPWSQPGVYESAPGVFRIPLPMPEDGLRAVNVYAFVHDRGVTMIDSGVAVDDARAALFAALGQLDVTPDDIDRFLVTHMHYDHLSQAVNLRDAYGFAIHLGRHEKPTISMTVSTPHEVPRERIKLLTRYGAGELIGQMGLGLADGEITRMAHPDRWISDADTYAIDRHTLRAVHTPGHTQGHMIFVASDHAFSFTGDHVLPHITPSIGFEPRHGPLPLGDYLQSLNRVRGMPDTMMLPAHGAVQPSVHDRIDELVSHHHTRMDHCSAALQHSDGTVYAVAQLLRWTRRERELGELDPLNRMLAILETGAHMDLLVHWGRLTRHDLDGVWHYAPSA